MERADGFNGINAVDQAVRSSVLRSPANGLFAGLVDRIPQSF
jgi:hypothetical protein